MNIRRLLESGNSFLLYLLIYLLVVSHTGNAQTLQEENSYQLDAIREKISTYYYSNFDSVKGACDELVKLSRREKRIDLELEAIYTCCWRASYHKRMPEFRSWMERGMQLLKDKESEIDKVDTSGFYRASMINAIGLYYFALGNYDKALEEYFRIITFDSTPLTGDSSLLRSTSNYIGQAYHYLGDLDRSIQYFELANKYIEKKDESLNYAKALYYMYQGDYLFSIGKVREAFASLQNSLNILTIGEETSAERNPIKANYLLTASFYYKIGQYDSAILFANKSIELHKIDDPDFVNTYWFIADVFYKRQLPDSAILYYTKSLNIANQLYGSEHFYKSKAWTGIGNIQRDRKNFEDADKIYKESLRQLVPHAKEFSIYSTDKLSAIVLPQEAMKVMVEKARLYYAWFKQSGEISRLDSCITILESAIFLNDISRRELVNIETKETKGRLQSDITDLGVEASSRAYAMTGNQKYLGKAFSFMEKGKANILMDQVNEVRARKFSGIPASVLEEEIRLKGELSINKDRFLRMKSSDAQFGDTKIQYDDKLREYITLISEMEQKYPKYYRLKYNAKNIEAEEIRKKLSSDHSLLIQFYVSEDNIYMTGITRDQTVLKVTDRNREFNDHLEILLKQLSNENIAEVENDSLVFRDFVRASLYLYGKLLSPVLKEMKKSVKELTIIPDGSLCYLPFEILLNHPYRSPKADYSKLPYIFKEYQIKYDYSASLIFEEEEEKRQKSANPYVGYAPSYEKYNNEVLPLGLLYANKEEIEACMNIWKGVSVTGDKATAASFRTLSPDINILHLALHTMLNDEDPQKSSLAFALDGQSHQDGLLYTYELYNMNIPARLVILSGCETGIGNIKKGEGIISLARAFKFAGSRNILMSLWKVNDQTTKEIMIAFTRNLKRGMEKDRALQQARITYLKKSKNLHPAFWSSFVLIGNDEPVHANRNWIIYSLIAIVLAVLIILLIKFFPRHPERSRRMTP